MYIMCASTNKAEPLLALKPEEMSPEIQNSVALEMYIREYVDLSQSVKKKQPILALKPRGYVNKD